MKLLIINEDKYMPHEGMGVSDEKNDLELQEVLPVTIGQLKAGIAKVEELLGIPDLELRDVIDLQRIKENLTNRLAELESRQAGE